jgi:D-3-phosphoglycerate dehydrogenase / 2-oxoglutarate reductase
MRRVVVTDQAFGGVEQEAAMAERAGAEFASHQCQSEDETAEAVRGADVALVNFAPMTQRVMSQMAPGATVVRYGIGYDNVDIEAARRLGVSVANVPDYGSETVADHAAAMLLMLLRRVPLYDGLIRRSGWCAPADVGPLPSFAATTIGLVGVGRIARLLASRLAAFGFTLVGYDPLLPAELATDVGVRLMPLDDVVRQAHALSLHVPATPETHHLVDGDLLSRMRPGSVLVNTSRGSLVDEKALAAALSDGCVAAAALDVFESEPLAGDSPLRACPNVVLTPHAAFYSTESLRNLQRLAAEEGERGLLGQPLRCPVT